MTNEINYNQFSLIQMMMAIIEAHQAPISETELRQQLYNLTPGFTDVDIITVINMMSSGDPALRDLVTVAQPDPHLDANTTWYVRGTDTWPHFSKLPETPELLRIEAIQVSDVYYDQYEENHQKDYRHVPAILIDGVPQSPDPEVAQYTNLVDQTIINVLEELTGEWKSLRNIKESELIARVILVVSHDIWIPQYLQIKRRLNYLANGAKKLLVETKANGLRMYHYYQLAF